MKAILAQFELTGRSRQIDPLERYLAGALEEDAELSQAIARAFRAEPRVFEHGG